MFDQDDAIDGKRIIEEYEHLKAAIMSDQAHTTHDGVLSTVRDSLLIPEGGNVVDKVRGGRVLWDESYFNQPCSHVDDDPTTYDRISLERLVESDGQVHGTASIIYSETSEMAENGSLRIVVDKLERYKQETPNGAVIGERYVKVTSPDGEILQHRHFRSAGTTPAR